MKLSVKYMQQAKLQTAIDNHSLYRQPLMLSQHVLKPVLLISELLSAALVLTHCSAPLQS